MENLGEMSLSELEAYRTKVLDGLKDNEQAYEERYQAFPGDYAASINDDYNGDGDEYTQLNALLARIDKEIRSRRKPS